MDAKKTTTTTADAFSPFRTQFVATAEQVIAAQEKWVDHQRAQAKAFYAFAETSNDVATKYGQSVARSWLEAMA
mgnify:CR=1 FL=1